MCAKSNGARSCRCAGCKFQKRRRIVTPIHCRAVSRQPNDLQVSFAGDVLSCRRCRGYDSGCLANFQRCIALSLADGLVKRKNDELLTQRCNEDRRPILVIANLHRDDRACGEHINFRVESARPLFNVTKAARDLAR